MENKYIIFMSDDICRLVKISQGEVSLKHVSLGHLLSVDAKIEMIYESLSEWGYQGEPAFLGIDSSWCLCATISTKGIDKSGRRRAMDFLMEEHLPISAEDVVTDYVEIDSDTALGVSCEFERLDAVIQNFTQLGVEIQNISPVALLMAEVEAEKAGDSNGILIASGGNEKGMNFDFITLKNSRPLHWWWFSGDKTSLCHRLTHWAESHDFTPAVTAINCEEVIADEDEINGKINFRKSDGNESEQIKSAAVFAERILDHQATAWIDLRCGKLKASNSSAIYNRPFKVMILSLILLLVCLAGIMYWRGAKYEDLAKSYRQQQIEVFKKAFPNSRRIPGDIVKRLASEQRKLAGLGGDDLGSDAIKLIRERTAFDHFQAVMKSLPGDIRYRILRLNIQDDVIRIDGQAQSHLEAQRILTPLGNTGLYDIEPPKTQALKDGGVDFMFTVRPSGKGA